MPKTDENVNSCWWCRWLLGTAYFECYSLHYGITLFKQAYMSALLSAYI